MKTNILVFALILFSLTLNSQSSGSEKVHHFDVGAGLGYEYGGIGFQFSVAPIKYASVFVGTGFNGGLGFNIGAKWHILPKTTRFMFRPYLETMWGYNMVAVTVGEGIYDVDQYYGLSAGAGCGMRFGANKRHGFDLCFFRYAFWSQEAWDRYNDTPEDERPALGPVGISIGYHFEF